MTASVNVKFVARQAILDRNESVFAYELLYRNSNENIFPANISDDVATARLFYDSLLFFGIDNLSGNKKIFINLSTNSILADLPKLISPKNVVLEIIERTKQLDQVLPLVENLMQNGYTFALDDYDNDPKWDALLQKVKYIKIEVGENIESTIKCIVSLKVRFPEKFIIVERIEDHASFELIKGAGADFFQGYYFTKPKVLIFKNINPYQATVLDLLKMTLQSPIDFNLLISKVEKDVALIARLLRICNLRSNYSSKKIHSISHAIVYLGEDTIKQFVSVLALVDLGEDKPLELLKIGLIRAKFIELLVMKIDKRLSAEGYLLGIVSIFSGLIDVELDFVFKELSLSGVIQKALAKQQGKLGHCYGLCLKIENGDFIGLQQSQKQLSLEENFTMQCYLQALAFADEAIV